MKVVITENQQKSLIFTLNSMIKNYGMDIASQAVGGTEILFKLLNIESPMDFLHLFDDLDVVQSEKNPNSTLFRYKKGDNWMIYNRESKDFHISYYMIWSFLEKSFGLDDYEVQKVIKEWLGEVYNLRGVTPRTVADSQIISWVRFTI